jgi:hypothetical protein
MENANAVSRAPQQYRQLVALIAGHGIVGVTGGIATL